ncbi:MAG TPA: hypothetical protein VID67_12540 [Rhizomicrobium sp.]|jgi:hypothetical protein
MGAARLLAKAWLVFCLFAGAYEAGQLLSAGASYQQFLGPLSVCVLLFGAMGLLFIAGYGVSGTGGSFRARLRLDHWTPGFNGLVFFAFAIVIFIVQVTYLPEHVSGGILSALESSVHFAIPGQRALEVRLDACTLDGGRVTASALSWLLALVFLGSALSRVRLAAGIVRLERQSRPDTLGPASLTLLLGIFAVVGIQFLLLGSIFPLMPCDMLVDIPGELLIGLGPLMLAYLIVAAVTDLLSLGPDA